MRWKRKDETIPIVKGPVRLLEPVSKAVAPPPLYILAWPTDGCSSIFSKKRKLWIEQGFSLTLTI
jgi:hypothetical protein